MKKYYKVFKQLDGELYPVIMWDEFYPYDKGCIITRADDCGPFAAFKAKGDAVNFASRLWNWGFMVIYRVSGSESKDNRVWCGGSGWAGLFPKGTVFLDEFEILEEEIWDETQP